MKKMKYIKYFTALALAALCLFACKKDKDKDLPSLNGSLRISLPGYFYPGDQIYVCPSGVYKKNEADTLLTVSCFNSIKGKSDTLRRQGEPEGAMVPYTYTLPDTLGYFYLSFTVSAKGYTSRYSSVYFYIVDSTLNSGSLAGYKLLGAGSMTDPRDGRTYPTITAGSTEWMMTNLAWEGAGVPYQNARAASRIFGRYYTWSEASGTICPEGWHLPSDSDWIALAEAAGATSVTSPADIPDAAGLLMGNISFNGSAMWAFAKDVRITDALSFSIIPVGYARSDGGSYAFYDYGKYACFWTADERDENMAVARYIFWNKPALSAAAMPKEGLAASVRCIK